MASRLPGATPIVGVLEANRMARGSRESHRHPNAPDLPVKHGDAFSGPRGDCRPIKGLRTETCRVLRIELVPSSTSLCTSTGFKLQGNQAGE
jgi:hypothetical protein